ncbi:MAG TPA: copper resistance protein CopC, partial [Actinomycetales bacterium]|nr:copper resistance protein CopC [Actinomycetales bacterium]
VAWRATSADGHPVSGDFDFTAEAAAPTPTEVPTTAEPTTSAPTTSPPETTDQGTGTEDDGLQPAAWLGIGAGVLVAAGAAAAVGRRRRQP